MDIAVQRQLKQLMVDSLPDCALVLLDTDGKVLSWNTGARGLLGYEEAEAVGQPFSRIVAPEALDPAGAPLSLARARMNGRHEGICRRMHSDGTDVELREVVIPLRDPQQTLVAFGLMMQRLDAARGFGAGAALGQSAMISTRNPVKVLLVDDDETVRTMAVHLLEDLGYAVLVAGSGAEALDILARDESVDLLFTDVIMPGMDGGELAEKARLMRPELKILFTSGYFEYALVKKGNISPNTNLLVKPYCGRELGRKLRRLFAEEAREPDELLLAGD